MKLSLMIKILFSDQRKVRKQILKKYLVRALVVIVSFLSLLLVGLVDYKTGYKVTFMPFYAIPIAVAAWYGTMWWGCVFAVTGGLVWLWASLMAGQLYPNFLIMIWDTLGRMIFFLSPVFLVELRKSLAREKGLSRQDYLTGILNRKGFIERLFVEMERGKRGHHPITFIMMDCDNFKYVNDHHGHQAGDSVLRLVAAALKEGLRITDVVARLGGDEFIILLSDADFDLSEKLIKRLRDNISIKMKDNGFPVTVSMGAVTYETIPLEVDDLLRRADAMMYFAKKKGKNTVEHEVIH